MFGSGDRSRVPNPDDGSQLTYSSRTLPLDGGLFLLLITQTIAKAFPFALIDVACEHPAVSAMQFVMVGEDSPEHHGVFAPSSVAALRAYGKTRQTTLLKSGLRRSRAICGLPRGHRASRAARVTSQGARIVHRIAGIRICSWIPCDPSCSPLARCLR